MSTPPTSPLPAASDEARERLFALVEAASAAAIGIRRDGMIVAWNRAAEALFGFPASEMIGQPALRLAADDCATAERERMEAELAGAAPAPFETRRVRRDGETVDIASARTLLRDRAGEPLGALELCYDITARKSAERKMQDEAGEELRASFRELGDFKAALDKHAIVAITDPQGRITYVNEKFCAISKYTSEELIGKDHRIINSGYHPKEFFTQLWQTIGRGQVWHGEIRNRAKDGSIYWVDTTIVPFLDVRGKPRQYVAIRAEITERKLAEEALRLRTEELARSNQDLEQFAYVASHDLQEPLRAVAGCVQILQRRYQGSLDARADELIGHAVDGANRMRKLIDDLLEFSRVGARSRALKAVNCQDAVAAALRNLTVAIRESGAEVTQDSLPRVLGDETRLTQLFQNLIANALKFRGEAPPRVHIGARPQGNEWVLSVKDNGIGIEPQYYDRIFGIFQRLHTRRDYPGTGVGLALCRRIVERHGGHIWVESKAGEGSEFLFTLPSAS